MQVYVGWIKGALGLRGEKEAFYIMILQDERMKVFIKRKSVRMIRRKAL